MWWAAAESNRQRLLYNGTWWHCPVAARKGSVFTDLTLIKNTKRCRCTLHTIKIIPIPCGGQGNRTLTPARPEVRRKPPVFADGRFLQIQILFNWFQAPLSLCACDRNRTCLLRGLAQVYFPLRYTDRRHSRTLFTACPRRVRRGYNGKRIAIQKTPCFATGSFCKN